MNTTLRLLAITALALSIPACASTPKKSDCCNTSSKCPPGSPQCKAPATKKKAG